MNTWDLAPERYKGRDERFHAVFERSFLAVAVITERGQLAEVNPTLAQALGQRREDLRGRNLTDLLHSDDREKILKLLQTAIDQGSCTPTDVKLNLKGEQAWIGRLTLLAVRNDHGEPTELIAVFENLTAQRRLEDQLTRQATHDPLTGLPNRNALTRELNNFVTENRKIKAPMVLMLLDLDRFRMVNDGLNHQMGDRLLRAVSERLRKAIEPYDLLTRVGGDEFGVVLRHKNPLERAAQVAQKITQTLSMPFGLEGRDLVIGGSLGVARFPNDATDAQSLLQRAETAMYSAKGGGKSSFKFYSSDMHAGSLERLELETQLGQALQHSEFEPYFQAQTDLATGRLSGFEVLIRWQHPTQGLVSPAKFIPVAEESGLIVPLGAWILQRACKQANTWRMNGFDDIVMAVNVSARQFEDPNFMGKVMQALKISGLPPKNLELELTESLVMQDPAGANKRMAELRELGVQLAIDDFGTGYSSLALLQKLPLNTLKIDRSFIRDLDPAIAGGTDKTSERLVEAMIVLAHNLGLAVVAEGIETYEQVEVLRKINCNIGQGFLFSKPIPAPQATEYIKTASDAASSMMGF